MVVYPAHAGAVGIQPDPVLYRLINKTGDTRTEDQIVQLDLDLGGDATNLTVGDVLSGWACAIQPEAVGVNTGLFFVIHTASVADDAEFYAMLRGRRNADVEGAAATAVYDALTPQASNYELTSDEGDTAAVTSKVVAFALEVSSTSTAVAVDVLFDGYNGIGVTPTIL